VLGRSDSDPNTEGEWWPKSSAVETITSPQTGCKYGRLG